MESQILTHLTTLESALTTLTRSISTFTPSSPATSTLLSTTHSLNHSLTDLAAHQANVQRIHALQAEATRLDIQLQTQLSALEALRRSVTSAPLSAPAPDARMVPSSAVTAFGRTVARAQPPRGWKAPSAMRAEAEAAEAAAVANAGTGAGAGAGGAPGGAEMQGATQATPSGSATPALATGAGTVAASPEALTPAVGAGGTGGDVSTQDAESETKNPGLQGLSDNDKALLNADAGYVPWVDEGTMARALLFSYTGSPVEVMDQLKQLDDNYQANEAAKAENKKEEERRLDSEKMKQEAPAFNWDA